MTEGKDIFQLFSAIINICSVFSVCSVVNFFLPLDLSQGFYPFLALFF